MLVVMYLCVRSINFVAFYAFSAAFWNCSDSVVFWNCSDSVVFWNCSDSVVFWNCSDSMVFLFFYYIPSLSNFQICGEVLLIFCPWLRYSVSSIFLVVVLFQ
jgi:hypothetical protein